MTDQRAHTGIRAATPMLIYDGDCGFCTSAVRRVERRLRPRCTIAPWQVTDLRSLGIARSRAASEVLWVTASGEVHGGAQAVVELLLYTGGLWRCVGALLTRPPISWLASGVYTVIARNRGKLPGGTPACALPGAKAGRHLSPDHKAFLSHP